jgi:hypothetical protein
VPTVTTNPAAQLKDWIKLYRRAASTPAPTQGAATAPAPQREQSAAPANPLGTVLPSIESLRNTGLPLLIYLVFVVLAVVLIRRVILNYGRRGGK